MSLSFARTLLHALPMRSVSSTRTPCIATQCAEASNLTHLLSLHVVAPPPHADNPPRRLSVHATCAAFLCCSHPAARVTNAQRLQHSHPHALPLSALRYPISRTCLVYMSKYCRLQEIPHAVWCMPNAMLLTSTNASLRALPVHSVSSTRTFMCLHPVR